MNFNNELVFRIKKLEAKDGFPLRDVDLTLSVKMGLDEYTELIRAKWNGHPIYIIPGQEPFDIMTGDQEEQDQNNPQMTLEQGVEDSETNAESYPDGEPQTEAEIEQELDVQDLEPLDEDVHAQAARQAEAYHADDDAADSKALYGWDCTIHNVRENNLDLKGVTATARVAHLVYGQESLCGDDFSIRPKATFIMSLGSMKLCVKCRAVHQGAEH